MGRHSPLLLFNVLLLPSVFHASRGNIIGDGRSSDSSSQDFFSRLDHDRSGFVSEEELSEVVSGFGGKALDEPDEIRRSMRRAFKQVDVDGDGSLSAAEANQFQDSIGLMYTVEGVAQWVVHGIQLPESVGEVFRTNAVTGYEFADLVENDGAAITDELGIERLAYRKKLLRSMRMVLSGVAVTPDPPQLFSAEGHSCSSIELRWGKPDGKGFAVHKYRVYRRFRTPQTVTSSVATPPALWNSGSSGGGGEATLEIPPPNPAALPVDASLIGRDSVAIREWTKSHARTPLPPPPTSVVLNPWSLVYDGASTEVVDWATAEQGSKYEYQVVAWNMFGPSPGSTTVGSPKATTEDGEPCDAPEEHPWLTWLRLHLPLTSVYSWSLALYKLIGACLVWASPIFAITTALVRMRRAALGHRRDAANQLHDGYTWRVLDFLSRVLPFGRELIPQVMRTDPTKQDREVYVIRRDGKASPAAVGTAGISRQKPPEMRRSSSSFSDRNDESKKACAVCQGSFKRPMLGIGVSRHTCSICHAHFCCRSACGKTNHTFTACPVQGECICKSCMNNGGQSPTANQKRDKIRTRKFSMRPRRSSSDINDYSGGAIRDTSFDSSQTSSQEVYFEPPSVPKLNSPPIFRQNNLSSPSVSISSTPNQAASSLLSHSSVGTAPLSFRRADDNHTLLPRILSGEVATSPQHPTATINATHSALVQAPMTKKAGFPARLSRSFSWSGSGKKSSRFGGSFTPGEGPTPAGRAADANANGLFKKNA